MAEDFYGTVTKEISKLGFAYWKNAKGSHEKWRLLEDGRILLIPRNLKSRHTTNGILKDAGSTKKI